MGSCEALASVSSTSASSTPAVWPVSRRLESEITETYNCKFGGPGIIDITAEISNPPSCDLEVEVPPQAKAPAKSNIANTIKTVDLANLRYGHRYATRPV